MAKLGIQRPGKAPEWLALHEDQDLGNVSLTEGHIGASVTA
jgi:hypothetical protein